MARKLPTQPTAADGRRQRNPRPEPSKRTTRGTFSPAESEPGERWVELAGHAESYWPKAEVVDPECVGVLFGPDGEVASALFDREFGEFGFNKDAWSAWRRYE